MRKENREELPMEENPYYSETELKSRYAELNLPQETLDLLACYFESFGNLYGILSLKEAYRIIQRQNKNLVTFEQLYAFSEVALHDRNHFYCLADADEMWEDRVSTPENREIIAQHLLSVDDECYYSLVEQQFGKPIFIPEKEELLRYADDCYYEKTPQAIALENFFKNKKKIIGEHFLDVMAGLAITSNISEEELMKDAFHTVAVSRIQLSDREIEEFAGLFLDFHNHHRLISNRGFTPSELFDRERASDITRNIVKKDGFRKLMDTGEISADELRNLLLDADIPEDVRFSVLRLADQMQPPVPSVPKVPRNAPCPCGSGKKYKNCCGKSESGM